MYPIEPVVSVPPKSFISAFKQFLEDTDDAHRSMLWSCSPSSLFLSPVDSCLLCTPIRAGRSCETAQRIMTNEISNQIRDEAQHRTFDTDITPRVILFYSITVITKWTRILMTNCWFSSTYAASAATNKPAIR